MGEQVDWVFPLYWTPQETVSYVYCLITASGKVGAYRFFVFFFHFTDEGSIVG